MTKGNLHVEIGVWVSPGKKNKNPHKEIFFLGHLGRGKREFTCWDWGVGFSRKEKQKPSQRFFFPKTFGS